MFLASSPPGFGLELLVVDESPVEGKVSPGVHLDRRPDRRADRGVYPGVGVLGVLSGKVDPPLCLC